MATYNPSVTTPITQALFNELRILGERYDDVSIMGAPEMAPHVHTGFNLRCSKIFEAHSVEPTEYIKDLARRGLRYKWVHFTGLLEGLDFAEVPCYGFPTALDEAIKQLAP